MEISSSNIKTNQVCLGFTRLWQTPSVKKEKRKCNVVSKRSIIAIMAIGQARCKCMFVHSKKHWFYFNGIQATTPQVILWLSLILETILPQHPVSFVKKQACSLKYSFPIVLFIATQIPSICCLIWFLLIQCNSTTLNTSTTTHKLGYFPSVFKCLFAIDKWNN